MTVDYRAALEELEVDADPWFKWRVDRVRRGQSSEPVPRSPAQDDLGGFIGPSGRPSPGSTGEALCHLALLGASSSGVATVAADWLMEVRTPAGAWLDPPDEVPGVLLDSGGARVWATAAASAGLLATGVDPGDRAFTLLRGDADQTGMFTGGAYPTFAGAAAFWMREGPRTETAEWALRWAREADDSEWGPWELATALTFWGAAGIGIDHLSVETFIDRLRQPGPGLEAANDPALVLRILELHDHFGVSG